MASILDYDRIRDYTMRSVDAPLKAISLALTNAKTAFGSMLSQSVTASQNATSAATAASNYAAGAQTSMTTSENLYRNWCASWLGIQSSDPTQSSMGDAPNINALYANSSENTRLKVYTADGWVDATVAADPSTVEAIGDGRYVRQWTDDQSYGIIYAGFNHSANTLNVQDTTNIWRVIPLQSYVDQQVVNEATTRANSDSALDSAKVNRSGDTMTGSLNILSPTNGYIGLCFYQGDASSSVQKSNFIQNPDGSLSMNAVIGSTTSTMVQWNVNGDLTSHFYGAVTVPAGTSATSAAQYGQVLSQVSSEATARQAADSALDSAKVNRAGDTMTGGLNMIGPTDGFIGIGFYQGTAQSSTLKSNFLQNTDGSLSMNAYINGQASALTQWNIGGDLTTHFFGAVAVPTGTASSSAVRYDQLTSQIASEATARQAADSALDSSKVSRLGDDMTGGLNLIAPANDFIGLGFYQGTPDSNTQTSSFVQNLDGSLSVNAYPNGGASALTQWNIGGDLTTHFYGAVTVPQASASTNPAQYGQMTSQIASEATARSNEDSAILSQLSAEVTNRTNADNYLGSTKVAKTGDTMSGSLGLVGSNTGYIGLAFFQTDGTTTTPITNLTQNPDKSLSLNAVISGQTITMAQWNIGGDLTTHLYGNVTVPAASASTNPAQYGQLTSQIASEATARANEDASLQSQINNRVPNQSTNDGTNAPITLMAYGLQFGNVWVGANGDAISLVKSEPGAGFNQIYNTSVDNAGNFGVANSSTTYWYTPSSQSRSPGNYDTFTIGSTRFLSFSTTAYDTQLTSFPVAFSDTPTSCIVTSSESQDGAGESVTANVYKGTVNKFNFTPHLSKYFGTGNEAIPSSSPVTIWVQVVGPA